MFRLDLGSTQQYCDGMPRRSFIQLGVAGMASVGLPQILRAKENSVAAGRQNNKQATGPILQAPGWNLSRFRA